MILEVEESVTTAAADGEIIGIQFGLASHQDIRTSSISDCGISHASQLANPFLGLPLETGKCESCGTAEPGKCEGHFGYIELPIPVYHPSHISELKRLLSLICLKCLNIKGKVPVKNNGIMERLLSGCCEEASHVSVKETKNNDGASFLELKIPGKNRVHDGAWNFLERFGYRYGDGSSRILLASEVLAMLKRIRDETKRKLAKKGFFPQDGYILQYLPVPPNCLSVPDVSDGVSVMSSDLCSSMLKKVLRQIEIIRSSRSGEPNFEAHEVEANDLYIAVSQYLEVRGTSRAARDGDKRFGVSKEGTTSSTKAWLDKMRTLFISKGSGFSSRSVITGDVYRPVNEVGIPSEIAHKMTFEERVNVHNIQYLQRLVDNNLCLTFRDGLSTYSLREGSKGHTFLKIGQVVHRRIMDGDIVFINRPPTTHKHSLQALRVYIHDDHVVKINPLMCGPLAADFDGDCVHLFYPQSLSARAEVVELFSVDKQLLSSHSGNLNLQLATDALLSLKTIFKLHFLDKASAQQLAMHASTRLPAPAVRKAGSAGPRWTAQQVLQTALPPQFECQGERMLIRGSEVVKLDFNRDIAASVMSDILTSLFFSKSPKVALSFLDSLQPLLMENLFAEGFSVSLRDFFVPYSELEVILSQIQDTIAPLLFQLRTSFNELIQLQFESSMKHLKLPLANFILKSSALGSLIESKSESAVEKIVQQVGFLGLQLSDKRKFYSKGLVEEVGSLFKMKHPFASLYPSEEFGLVSSCFFRGLDAYEGMVHSIATREVIVRSSKGLAEPGTLFKNLMAVLRDVVICYDGSVRNVSSNSVIQFEYGLEGLSSQSLFPPGEPVGVLAATAMSNPAYKAVLDSSPSSNSSWDLMKEILFCRANFRNDLNDRRVILYLNDCACGRKYCQENASYAVKNHLQKVSLRDAAVEFSIEYKRPKAEPGSMDIESGLVGHIHLNADLLRESRITMHDVLQKCEEEVNILKRKKKYGQCFKRMALSVSDCCLFQKPGSWNGAPCLKFFWEDIDQPNIEKMIHIMADMIIPMLLDTVIKGDPRISTVKIVWINPGTTSWVQSASSDRKGELGVEVTLEKEAIRQSGDAWRIVLDCCLPVFHMIDTKRSIPYAIKQIQDLLGISCGFDQAVQRLSTSVTSVTKGVLKEHLILLASSMTCSGTLVGFNTGGIKALYRALSVQAPFTEATLYTPRKCFERASEKCHVDSLEGIVASCSWGKRVAVGTGTNFDVLWDTKEIEKENKSIDVYNFLHLVRGSNEEAMDTGGLGEDIDWEDAYMEPALSPDQDNKAVFEDVVDVDLDSNEQGGGGSTWDALNSNGAASEEGSGWSNWGQKKESAQADDSSKSAGWGTPSQKDVGSSKEESAGWANWGTKKNSTQPEDQSKSGGWGASSGSADGNGSANWGSKKDQSQPEDSSKSGGWGKPSQKDVGSGSAEVSGWGAKKDPPQAEDKSGSGGWGAPKIPKEQGWSAGSGSAEGNGSANWGSKKGQAQPEDSSKASGWGTSKTQGTEKEKTAWGTPSADTWKQNNQNGETKQAWNSSRNDGGEKSSVETTGGSWSKNSNEGGGGGWQSKQGDQNAGSGGWGSEKKESNSQASGWGASKTQAVPQKEDAPQSSWGQQKSSSGVAGGWSSEANRGSGFKSRDSNNDEPKSQSSWGQSNTSTQKNSAPSANAWGSDKSSQPDTSTGWGSGKATVPSADKDTEESGSGGWGSKKVECKTQSSWGQPNDSMVKNDVGKDNDVGGSKSWGSRKQENNTKPAWGQPKDATEKKEEQIGAWGPKVNEVGGSKSWGAKTGNNNSQFTWSQSKDATVKNDKPTESSWKSSPGGAGWGSGTTEPASSINATNDEDSGGWGSKSQERKSESSWGQQKSSSGADSSSGWGSGKTESGNSNKAQDEEGSGGWGSKSDDKKSQSSWGQGSETTTWKSTPSGEGWGSSKLGQAGSSPGRGSGRGDSGGGRGWGSSNSGEWKSRKNRPPRQPGSTDEPTNIAWTATRKRMDTFPAEEQDALSEMETVLQSIRRIMHQSGSNDGDPLPAEDQTYVINNVLEYHPDKEAKKGAGVDYITVKKHSSFQDSRCFYVVSTDGQAEDFSYIKCLENFVKGKYPAVAESFNSKYFRKPRPQGPRPQGQQNFSQNSPGSPNSSQTASESPNFTQTASESPSDTQTAPETPNVSQTAPESPNNIQTTPES